MFGPDSPQDVPTKSFFGAWETSSAPSDLANRSHALF